MLLGSQTFPWTGHELAWCPRTMAGSAQTSELKQASPGSVAQCLRRRRARLGPRV